MTNYIGRLTNTEKKDGKVVFHYPCDWTPEELFEAVAERLWKLEEKHEALIKNKEN